MDQRSRRDFLKTGLAAATLVGVGGLPADSRAGDSDRLGNARKIKRKSDAARIWHGHP